MPVVTLHLVFSENLMQRENIWQTRGGKNQANDSNSFKFINCRHRKQWQMNLMLLCTGFWSANPNVMVAFLFRHKIYKYSSQNERNTNTVYVDFSLFTGKKHVTQNQKARRGDVLRQPGSVVLYVPMPLIQCVNLCAKTMKNKNVEVYHLNKQINTLELGHWKTCFLFPNSLP